MSAFVERVKREPWLLALCILALVILWLLTGLIWPKQRVADVAAPANADAVVSEVQARMLTAEPVARVVSLSARIEPARTVELKAETSGRVVAVGAARGTRVAAGTLIVRLDVGDRMARATQARATLKQREIEFAGLTKLKPEGYISDAKMAETAAQLEAARAELQRANIDLARMSIRAPFAGALQDRTVEVGDYVSPGTTVATFVDERTLVASASLAEDQAAGLKRGAQGTARLSTGETVAGVVRYVAPVADPATRTFKVELEFPNARGLLPAGVTAEVQLPLGSVMAHRLSPALLTLDENGAVGVKLLGEQSRVRFLPVAVVRSSPDGIWVQGLPKTATVITVGQGYVRTGQVVKARIDLELARK
jgi:multidrug efflux system membrane fusion protein